MDWMQVMYKRSSRRLAKSCQLGRFTCCCLAFFMLSASAQNKPAEDPLDAEVRAAFLYAYPYYEFMWLRDQALNKTGTLSSTSLNLMRHQRHLATPQDRWANGPIHDTFYSTGWLDVGQSPVVLSVPDTADRYYVIVFIGADTNSFESIGRRSTGTKARKITIIGPDWQGAIPPADQVIRAPTRDLYVNMRMLVRDAADMPQVHALQDAIDFKPVASISGSTTLNAPERLPKEGDVGQMLDVINESLTRNPPPVHEAALLEKYRAVGICGAACRWDDLPPAVQARWRTIVPQMIARLKTALDGSRRDRSRTQGWLPFRLPRNFANNYALRAGSAANSGGIFGLEAAEAVYLMGLTDDTDTTLGEGRRYRLHLPAGGLPADAFWSVTLYEFQEKGQYLLANPIDRYSIGDRTQGLVRNADGSLDIWLQPEAPSNPAQQANWLPSPVSKSFYLNARIYQPRKEVLDPAWAMPAIERLLP